MNKYSGLPKLNEIAELSFKSPDKGINDPKKNMLGNRGASQTKLRGILFFKFPYKKEKNLKLRWKIMNLLGLLFWKNILLCVSIYIYIKIIFAYAKFM